MSLRRVASYLVIPILAFPCQRGLAGGYQVIPGALWSMPCGGPCSYTVRIGEARKVVLPNSPYGGDRKIVRVEYYPVQAYAVGRELKAIQLESRPKYWFAFCDYELLADTRNPAGEELVGEPVYYFQEWGKERLDASTVMMRWSRWNAICSSF